MTDASLREFTGFFEIALVLVGGAVLVSTTNTGNSDLRNVLVSFGLIFVFLALILWSWDREKYYKDRLKPHP